MMNFVSLAQFPQFKGTRSLRLSAREIPIAFNISWRTQQLHAGGPIFAAPQNAGADERN
jgi:hypothetical protein